MAAIFGPGGPLLRGDRPRRDKSVTSLTATPLTHRYKGRYDSNANALLRFLTRGFR